MTDRDDTIKRIARGVGKACEMNDYDGKCIEGRDCAECSIATEPAAELYDAGCRFEKGGEL